MQQHQRDQAGGLRVAGQQAVQQPAQPDRLVAQLRPYDVAAAGRRVPLVEHQVDHALHTGQPLGEGVGTGYREADPGLADLPLRAYQALGHRGFGQQEGARDLPGREPGHVPQRQRDPDLERQRRVAAGEDQPELVVLRVEHLVVRPDGLAGPPHLRCLLDRHLVAPELVEGLTPRGHRQPGAGLRGYPFLRPGSGGRRERLLCRILGALQVAESARQRGDDRRPLLPERAIECGGAHSAVRCQALPISTNSGNSGRISTVPPRTIGIRAAHSIAASRSAASIR